MLELIFVDHTQFLRIFSQEQCVDSLFDSVVFAMDLNTKFCLDLFSAPVTERKTAIATIPFTSYQIGNVW